MSKLTNVAKKYPIEAESSILYMWNIFKEWIIIDFAKYLNPYPYPKFQYAKVNFFNTLRVIEIFHRFSKPFSPSMTLQVWKMHGLCVLADWDKSST